MSVFGKVWASTAASLGLGIGLLTVAVPSQAQYEPRYDQGPQVYCASNDGRFARCQVPWRDAVLVQQMSKTRCVRNQTWGFDGYGIWVNNGCRGEFSPARGWPPYGGPGPGRPPGWGGDRPQLQVRCESRGGSYQLCPVDLRRDDSVRIVNQLSGADCRQGRSWGWSRDGIWVDRGCRADFVIERRY
ncbi:DUF3011 domain-containing protein [Dyella flagellata]|uniref:DUF3011 domain-containing protein n=1 Tax=Dyella flagellata TaxID=1867833 RepID=A0ABQ5X4J9_9GAMM|nr:DUF3011 domain-containing protein [Dyella flagellata]GLQ86463.1 hypothetical protein GCM10007898_00290 [Dyella flagellata]